MADLLNDEDATQARALGWRVVEVYDLRTKRLYPTVVPANNVERWSAPALLDRIKELARRGHRPAINTLSALVRPVKGSR